MKQLFILILVICLGFGASAQDTTAIHNFNCSFDRYTIINSHGYDTLLHGTIRYFVIFSSLDKIVAYQNTIASEFIILDSLQTIKALINSEFWGGNLKLNFRKP